MKMELSVHGVHVVSSEMEAGECVQDQLGLVWNCVTSVSCGRWWQTELLAAAVGASIAIAVAIGIERLWVSVLVGFTKDRWQPSLLRQDSERNNGFA